MVRKAIVGLRQDNLPNARTIGRALSRELKLPGGRDLRIQDVKMKSARGVEDINPYILNPTKRNASKDEIKAAFAE